MILAANTHVKRLTTEKVRNACQKHTQNTRAQKFTNKHTYKLYITRVSDPVWYWPYPDTTSHEKPDPDPWFLKPEPDLGYKHIYFMMIFDIEEMIAFSFFNGP